MEEVSLKQVYEELRKIEQKMITKEEIESLIETVEIMSNPRMVRKIADSMEDIKNGRVKKIKSVNDMIKEMDI